MNVIELTKALIRCPSVTPVTAGAFDVIEGFLKPLGFEVHRVTFEGDHGPATENLYARWGKGGKNFCFAGHTDVVPPGDLAAWSVPPFEPTVKDGELVGRGAEDMKGAIAAFMIAVRDFIEGQSQERAGAKGGKPPSSISFLITQDEEGSAINGTRKMLAWLSGRGEKIDACLVGEPTNPDFLGEMVKIGRRGSISFTLEVFGKQGHAAYPERADNPVTRILNMLHALKSNKLDDGTAHFPPSNLEVTSIDVGNLTTNVIPAAALARFNVRFNNLHTGDSIMAWVEKQCAPFGRFVLASHKTGEAFLTRDEQLIHTVSEAVHAVTGHVPLLSTTGGTSDARFIKDVCPVIEFGTTGRTAHMVDERVEVKTLEGLTKVYGEVLKRYFSA